MEKVFKNEIKIFIHLSIIHFITDLYTLYCPENSENHELSSIEKTREAFEKGGGRS